MHKMADPTGKFQSAPPGAERCEDEIVAQYAPAGGVLLAIGGTAAILTEDAITVALSVILMLLGYLFARSLRPTTRGEARE